MKDGVNRRVVSQRDMTKIAKQYFMNLFSTSFGSGSLEHVLSRIDCSISVEANMVFTAPYMEEEVFTALKGMEAMKASSVDGFSAFIF